MAKKKTETVSLVDTFAEFKETKHIDRATLIGVMEESFRSVLAKKYGSDENFDVIINDKTGDVEIYRKRTVVEDGNVTDPNKEVALSEVPAEDEYEVGEEYLESIDFASFGRRAILNLRQTLQGRIVDLEHDNLLNKYKELVGKIVTGEVYQTWKNEVLLLDDDGNELILPKSEQIPRENIHKESMLRAVVKSVDMVNNTPKIILSRTAPTFLARMLEQEVPEIADGLITIRGVARIPGERAKVAVESYDERIDPVGACVGVKGRRVHGIVRELCGENVDVLTYTTNRKLYVQRALSPAKVSDVVIYEEEKKAEVYLPGSEVSLAIGRGGQNIKLASMLTGYTIDVYRSDEVVGDDFDIMLDEFDDEIEGWVLDELKKAGYRTGRAVLDTPREDLLKQVDLEEETVDHVLNVLKAEFERDETEE